MTTIAMVAGMVPSALAFGAGGEFRSPMALAVIGGLMFSTVLSLVFVPAMFMLMDDLGTLSARLARKVLRTNSADDAGITRRVKPAPPMRRLRNNVTALRAIARELRQVEQQDAAALQIEDSVLAPLLQLAIDAFARRADEDAKLLLRDVDFGAEIRRQRAQPPRQAHRQRLQHRLFHPLADPADPLAQQLDEA